MVECGNLITMSVPTTIDKLSLRREIDWVYVVFHLQSTAFFIFGLHVIFYQAHFLTTFFSLFLITLGNLGVTAGSHRLWAHNSYNATTSLKVFLMLCQTLTGHTSIYNWVKLHRLQHKHFQTDLDPYNTQQGFIHSHIICSCLKLSPAQEKSLSEIDMSDLENDKIVMFQKKYYWLLFTILTLLLPINAPVEYWGETISNSALVLGSMRITLSYHLSVLIYTARHIFDFKSSDKNQFDSNLVFFINKSYWISYHYLAPWDYQTGEYGNYGQDGTSKFIRVCAALELASDLKIVENNVLRDSLAASVGQNRPIQEIMLKTKHTQDLFKQHYLTPSAYY